LRKLEN